jgi:hypothetical protein
MNWLNAKSLQRGDDTLTANSSQVQVLQLPCAWCNDERGIPQGEGSHGICQRHSNYIYAEYIMRRANEENSRFARGEVNCKLCNNVATRFDSDRALFVCEVC